MVAGTVGSTGFVIVLQIASGKGGDGVMGALAAELFEGFHDK